MTVRVDPDDPATASLLVALDDSDIQAQLDSAEKRRDGLVASVTVDEQRIAASEAALGRDPDGPAGCASVSWSGSRRCARRGT